MSGAIAPAGAMQFRYRSEHPQDHGSKCVDPGRKLECIWVLQPVPAIRRDWKCKCKRVFPVIYDLLPEDVKVRVAAQDGINKCHVCPCQGEIIE